MVQSSFIYSHVEYRKRPFCSPLTYCKNPCISYPLCIGYIGLLKGIIYLLRHQNFVASCGQVLTYEKVHVLPIVCVPIVDESGTTMEAKSRKKGAAYTLAFDTSEMKMTAGHNPHFFSSQFWPSMK